MKALKMRTGTWLPHPAMGTSCPVQRAAALSRLTQGHYAGREQKGIKCLVCQATESPFHLLEISPIKIKQSTARLPREITDGAAQLFSYFSPFVPTTKLAAQCTTLSELLSCAVTGLDFNHRDKSRGCDQLRLFGGVPCSSLGPASGLKQPWCNSNCACMAAETLLQM